MGGFKKYWNIGILTLSIFFSDTVVQPPARWCGCWVYGKSTGYGSPSIIHWSSMLIICIGLSPFPVITTRINSFLVTNPNLNLQYASIKTLWMGRGATPSIYIYLHRYLTIYIYILYIYIVYILYMYILPELVVINLGHILIHRWLLG